MSTEKDNKILTSQQGEENITNVSEPMKTCFIITPIGNPGSVINRHISGVLEGVIRPVCEQHNYNCIFADSIPICSSITDQIIKYICCSDLVIANLTGKNPNVMYELAIRHCVMKPIILISDNVDSLPFDVNTQRTIIYSNDMMGACELRNQLDNFFRHIDQYSISDSPIYKALGGEVVRDLFMKTLNLPQTKYRSEGIKRDITLSEYYKRQYESGNIDENMLRYFSLINEKLNKKND